MIPFLLLAELPPIVITEHLSGDVTHSSYRLDHGGSNYHEHLCFETVEMKDRAKIMLEKEGIRIGSEYRHNDPGCHGVNRAIDIPADQVPIGSEQDMSHRVRMILGID
jgi:hypothetical protein